MNEAPLNAHLVGVQGDKIIINFPPRVLTKDDALVFAAWIAVIADPVGTAFADVLDAVKRS